MKWIKRVWDSEEFWAMWQSGWVFSAVNLVIIFSAKILTLKAK